MIPPSSSSSPTPAWPWPRCRELRRDHAGITLVGAVLLLVLDQLMLDQAVGMGSIDSRTIDLRFGWMIACGFLRIAGFFEYVTGHGTVEHYWSVIIARVARHGSQTRYLIHPGGLGLDEKKGDALQGRGGG